MTPQLPSLSDLPAALLASESAIALLPAAPSATTKGAEAPDFGALLKAGTAQSLALVPASAAAIPAAAPAANPAAILPDAGKTLPLAAALPTASPLRVAPDLAVTAKGVAVRAATPLAVSASPSSAIDVRPATADPKQAVAVVAKGLAGRAAQVDMAEELPPPAADRHPAPLTPPARRPHPGPLLQLASGPSGDEDEATASPLPLPPPGDGEATFEAAPAFTPIALATALPPDQPSPARAAPIAPDAMPGTARAVPPPGLRQPGRTDRSERNAATPAETPAQPAEQRFSAAALSALAPAEQSARILASPDSTLPLPGSPGPASQPGSPAPTAVAAAASPDPASAAVGPDLARMVETIARARAEVQQVAAAGGSVHVALRHVEFGAVSVRFEHDRGDIAVSMSSPDPGFARAVAAVAAPQPAAASGDAGARPSDGQASPAQSGGQGTPQQRSQGEAQPRQPFVTHQPARRGAAGAPASTPDGEGIFA